jgi:uncharacterized membrane protein (Fun14 family)
MLRSVEGSAADGGGETSGLAIASVILGIVWLFGLGSIAAIALGWRAVREVEGSDGALEGHAIAIAGIVIGAVGLASSALLVAFLLGFRR